MFEVLQLLSKSYCIIKREKVIDLSKNRYYDEYKFLHDVTPEDLNSMDVDTLRNHADEMYYMIENLINFLKTNDER